MSYTQDWMQYPEAFTQLVEKAALEVVRVPCADDKDALRLRQRLYSFFGAVHKAAAKDPTMLALDHKIRKIQLRASGSDLIVRPSDLDADNALVRAALGSSSPMVGGVPMSPEMQEMMSKPLTSGG